MAADMLAQRCSHLLSSKSLSDPDDSECDEAPNYANNNADQNAHRRRLLVPVTCDQGVALGSEYVNDLGDAVRLSCRRHGREARYSCGG
jgi:hypothetical protein